MGTWLQGNRKKMKELALMINASGSRKMYIIFPNLGPACYNATILRNYVNINKNNIVVATSDVGMEILPVVAKVAQVPMRNIFCPPVWGFVGINKLVDIQTTIHMYNTFNPYKRYTRVRQSSLNIGSITPERRPLDYLMHFNETLWMEVAEMKVSALLTTIICMSLSILEKNIHWLTKRLTVLFSHTHVSLGQNMRITRLTHFSKKL